MKEIHIDNRNKLKTWILPIGIGSTATVFKGKNNDAVKIFFEYYLDSIKHQGDYVGKLTKLCDLSSEKMIGPKVLIYEKGTFIGYIYELIKGKQFVKISSSTKINDLFIDYELACDEIYRLSMNHFDFCDLYSRNIIFHENKYYFIDLDKGSFDSNLSSEQLFLESRKRFFTEIINTIYGINHSDYPIFRNIDISKYKKSYDLGKETVSLFLDEIKNLCNDDKPSLKKVRTKTLSSVESTAYHTEF